jgi:hypothetical protein
MKQTAGILTGILLLMTVQVFLVLREDDQKGVQKAAGEWVQAKYTPDTTWLENPDENHPALARNAVPKLPGNAETPRKPVRDPRFRFTLREGPNPLYTDRPPPAEHA